MSIRVCLTCGKEEKQRSACFPLHSEGALACTRVAGGGFLSLPWSCELKPWIAFCVYQLCVNTFPVLTVVGIPSCPPADTCDR